ncbi:MAG: sacsin N-terminal ATP-binding-like domain-containing protein, partial [Pseudonocardia sp.]
VGEGVGGEPEVQHAPTPTSERLSLPARLFATVPLDPDRRHVRAGAAADRVLAAAAQAYVDLVRALDPLARLALVPAAGFPRSATDGRLHELILDALRAAEWLPGAAGADLAPGRAEWLDVPGDALPALLAGCGAFPGLLAPVPRPPAALGVERLGPAALADRLLGVEMAPSWWRALYEALVEAADTVPGLVDELRALPVPLVVADDHRRGRSVAGPAGVLLAAGVLAGPGGPARPGYLGRPGDPGVPGGSAGAPAVEAIAALGLPGLHVAHPDAVHPLLARLGAAPADAAALLAHPAVVAAVERSVDDADAGLGPQSLAAAVLGLLGQAGAADVAALALPDADGGVARADELMLPDAALRPLLADDAPLGVLDPAWAARFPRAVLAAAGVVDGFAVLADDHPAGPDHDLDDEERWWDALAAPPARLVAVRDLDLVAGEAWPAALALLAADRDTRAAVLAPGSYTAWWLARHARLGGHRPGHWRLPSAPGLAALYDPVPPVAADDAFLGAVGVRATLAVTGSRDAADLLDRLADPQRRPDPALVAAAHAALAAAVRDGVLDPADVEPPSRVRALDGTVVDAGVAVVLDLPWLAAVLPAGEVVAGGDVDALAELLDLPAASEVVDARVRGQGRPVCWVDLPDVVLACAVLDTPVPAGELHRHDTLTVELRRPGGAPREVPAWRDEQGRWHAGDPLRALLGLLAARGRDGSR